MANHQTSFSREGHHWTPHCGLQAGLPSISVIRPQTNRTVDKVYDVVVIGAGYAGLVAARDLSVAGHEVLLIEARDRIGGRTWSSDIEGYPYELGGTWVHWHQPFVWRELNRYGISSELDVSPASGYGLDQTWVHRKDGSVTKMSHQQEFELLSSAMKKFVDVDGKLGRDVIPLPYDLHRNPATALYDKMSFADRLGEIRDSLNPLEYEVLETFLSLNAGGTMENSSFLDMLRWWAVGNYDMGWYNDLCLTYKLKIGQSALARRMFDEALATDRLTYQFDAAVAAVEDDEAHVLVTDRSGQQYKAKRAISTLPLNVMTSVEFSPPLSSSKKTAGDLGHVNHCTKVHAEVVNPDLRSFSGWRYNSALGMAFGDGTTPAGNTHLVAFGPSYEDVRLIPTANNGQDTLEAIRGFAPDHIKDVKRLVFHDWNEDEFAKGTWEFLRPEMASKYIESLRQRQGNVLFASADWATGWRGFIDGAIEEGTRVAKELNDEFTSLRRLEKHGNSRSLGYKI